MSVLGFSLALLTVSGTALGFGIACVADGNGDAGCVLLVLAPVIAGFPLGAALGIWGAAERDWLRRWGEKEEEESPRSRPLDSSVGAGLRPDARGERGEAGTAKEVPFDSAQDRLRQAPSSGLAYGASSSGLASGETDERIQSKAGTHG